MFDGTVSEALASFFEPQARGEMNCCPLMLLFTQYKTLAPAVYQYHTMVSNNFLVCQVITFACSVCTILMDTSLHLHFDWRYAQCSFVLQVARRISIAS